MKAIEFPAVNVWIAEHQDEYETLPVYVEPDNPQTPMTMCFELDEAERIQVQETGKIWLTMLTFGQKFHPIRMSCKMPNKLNSNLKVFLFINDGNEYAICADSVEKAREYYEQNLDGNPDDSVEEIPQSKWDEKFIKEYEENDFEKAPSLISIRDCISSSEPHLVYSTDLSLID